MCAYPGINSEPRFFCNPGGELRNWSQRFFVGNWADKSDRFGYIYDECTAVEVLKHIDVSNATDSKNEPSPWEITVGHNEYIITLRNLINEIQERGIGKVVLSRTKSVNVGLTGSTGVSVACRMFESFPHTFRFLYYLPETGFWMGASPELLLSYNKKESSLSTMALAGTRASSDSATSWSDKDVREQALVESYIVNELESLGYKVNCSAPETVSIGNIQHIATSIYAVPVEKRIVDASTILDALNPTPALCGYPRVEAEEIISHIERHPRRCYGGVVGIETLDRLDAYVNLRCAHFDDKRVCQYAGGGILRESVPEQEWLETERKMSSIGCLFEKTGNDGGKG